MKRKIILFIALFIVSVAFLIGCSSNNSKGNSEIYIIKETIVAANEWYIIPVYTDEGGKVYSRFTVKNSGGKTIDTDGNMLYVTDSSYTLSYYGANGMVAEGIIRSKDCIVPTIKFNFDDKFSFSISNEYYEIPVKDITVSDGFEVKSISYRGFYGVGREIELGIQSNKITFSKGVGVYTVEIKAEDLNGNISTRDIVINAVDRDAKSIAD